MEERGSRPRPRPLHRYPRQNLGLGRLSGILRPLLGSQRDAFHQEFWRDFLPDLPAPARGLSGRLPTAERYDDFEVSSIDAIWQIPAHFTPAIPATAGRPRLASHALAPIGRETSQPAMAIERLRRGRSLALRRTSVFN